MPLYEYRCKCGYRFESRKPVEERQTAVCPKCGEIAEKKLSVVNFTFGFTLSDESWNDDNRPAAHDELVRNV